MNEAPIEIETDSYWKFQKINTNCFHLLRRHYYPKKQAALDATGAYWFFGVAKVKSGTVTFKQADKCQKIKNKSYGFFLPPYSLIHWELNSLVQEIECIVSNIALEPHVKKKAIVFSPRNIKLSQDTAQKQLSILNHSTEIEYNCYPSGISQKIKKEIDQSYLKQQKLYEIANKLKTSQTQMGRYFKKDFQLSPIHYRNHMRIIHSVFELMKSKSITNVFQEVGFEDLSRFNKQFKAHTGVTPKKYKPKKKSKNAKK